MRKINLKKCKQGDLLVSKHGKLFIYDSYNKTLSFPHRILDFITQCPCSRTDDGQVFRNKKLEEDHDIIIILKDNGFYSKERVINFIKYCWGYKNESIQTMEDWILKNL